MGQIKVSGDGEATARPDYLTLTVTTETVAKTATGVRAAHVERSSAVQRVIEAAGVTGKDVERSSFRYAENSVWNDRTHEKERRGFKATSTTAIRFRDFGGVPALLDDLTAAGATGISGPDFAVDDERRLADAARVAAYRDARRKADALCAEAGCRVVGIREMNEREGELYGGGKAGSNVARRDDGQTLLGDVRKTMTIECTFDVAEATEATDRR